MNLPASNLSSPRFEGPPPDPVQCPLCGQPNRCAMEIEKETGQAEAPCWCADVNFEPALLAQIPASSRRLACVCRACATPALAAPAE